MPELMDHPSGLVAPVVDFYLREFGARRSQLAAEPSWLRDYRQGAIEAFGRMGFPTTRQEEWRFTNVSPIASRPIPQAAATANAELPSDLPGFPALQAAAELVFVNGVLAPSKSSAAGLPAGVRVESLATTLGVNGADLAGSLGRLSEPEGNPFAAMNAALFGDAAVVLIPPGARVAAPIHLVYVASNAGPRIAVYPRALIVAGAGSEVRIVESFIGRDGQEYFTNAVTEIVVSEGANLDHYRVQRESSRAFHLGALRVRCGRQSSFSSHSLSLGGALVRNEVSAVLADEGGSCVLNGLYLADDETLVDNHTTIDHASPHCESHEFYKGVLGGHARGVFHGKIVVRPDAQKTDAKQTNKALLLSDQAQVNSKPQLEIFANDVKCTHGAAVGQLDDEAVFYLRARGVGADDARRMLIGAFVGDLLGRVRIPVLRSELETVLQDRLELMLRPGSEAGS